MPRSPMRSPTCPATNLWEQDFNAITEREDKLARKEFIAKLPYQKEHELPRSIGTCLDGLDFRPNSDAAGLEARQTFTDKLRVHVKDYKSQRLMKTTETRDFQRMVSQFLDKYGQNYWSEYDHERTHLKTTNPRVGFNWMTERNSLDAGEPETLSMTLLKQIFHVRAQKFNRNNPEKEQAQADTASISSKDPSLVDNDGRKRPAERSPSPEHTHLSKLSKMKASKDGPRDVHEQRWESVYEDNNAEDLRVFESHPPLLHQSAEARVAAPTTVASTPTNGASKPARDSSAPLPTNVGLLDKHSTVKPVAAAAAKPKKRLKERYSLDLKALQDHDFSKELPLVVASEPRRKQRCFVDSGDDEPSAAPDTSPHQSLVKTFLMVTAEFRPERGPVHVVYEPSHGTDRLFDRLATECRIPAEIIKNVTELIATFTWTGKRLRIRKAVEGDLSVFEASIVRAREEDYVRFKHGCEVEIHLHIDE
ncbi:MAG: hypothetical protein Q9207_000257 [Kuettlingeria erythrocarpa]